MKKNFDMYVFLFKKIEYSIRSCDYCDHYDYLKKCKTTESNLKKFKLSIST